MLVFSVCDWLDCVASPKFGFKPLTVLHTYPDTEPLFAAIATRLIPPPPPFFSHELCGSNVFGF
jgi:hypothetical protein